MVPEFFASKPVDRLIRPGLEAHELNDDVLGRALDSLYDYGVTKLYHHLALQAAKRLGLTSRFAHLDSSSFHVDGVYNSDTPPKDAGVIHITKGYSRDHRPDLNQVMLELVAENQAGIPVLMKPLSGNSNDARDFRAVITEHVKQLQEAHEIPYLVADSALYNQESVQEMQQAGIKWITRVPATLSEAKAALADITPEEMLFLAEGYRYQALHSNYRGVPQRWLLVYSEAANARAQKQVRKELSRQSEADVKALLKLGNEAFACRDDAKRALERFTKKLIACTLTDSEIK